MAKRLNERELRWEAPVSAEQLGREICRNCGGGIVVEPVDHRPERWPHRKVCRRCGAEYGTTRGG
ncbi:MAG: hypothetical protein HYY35_06130 [Deltaproteobacteria bacterium]|nr:hypothetical protein [Deltaproteobacteria bacterium]